MPRSAQLSGSARSEYHNSGRVTHETSFDMPGNELSRRGWLGIAATQDRTQDLQFTRLTLCH